MTLYRDPIVWSDNKQIVGEEINAYMNDSTLDSIYVDRQALTIERVDSTHFNQVASQQMRTYFDTQGEVKENRAIGNVMVVNYPLERIAQSFTKTMSKPHRLACLCATANCTKYGRQPRTATFTPSDWHLPTAQSSRALRGLTTYALCRLTTCSTGVAKRGHNSEAKH